MLDWIPLATCCFSTVELEGMTFLRETPRNQKHQKDKNLNVNISIKVSRRLCGLLELTVSISSPFFKQSFQTMRTNLFSEAWDLAPIRNSTSCIHIWPLIFNQILTLLLRANWVTPKLAVCENRCHCSCWALRRKLFPPRSCFFFSELGQITKNSKKISLRWADFPTAVKTEYFSTTVLSLPVPTLEALHKRCRRTGESSSHTTR